MEGTPEHVANKFKESAIELMKSADYIGAQHKLHLARRIFPALRGLPCMTLVCWILHQVDIKKPNYGVDWFFILKLPSSAPTSKIVCRMRDLIYCFEAIEREFPGTDIAKGFLHDAMRHFPNRRELNHVKKSLVSDAKTATNVADMRSSGSLKRKMPSQNCFSNRVVERSSFVENNESLGNFKVVSAKLAYDDHPKSKKDQIELGGYPTKLKSVIEFIKNDSNQAPSNGCDVYVNGGKQVGEGPSCVELGTYFSRGSIEVHPCGPKLKDLLDAIPQSPHYIPLNEFGAEFRRSIITGIEIGFVAVAEQIRNLVTSGDVKSSTSNIFKELMYLENMGYDVQKLRARLEELSQLAERKQAALDASQKVEEKLKDWKAQREANEAKNFVINSLAVELKQKIQKLEETYGIYQSVISFRKGKEVEVEQRRKSTWERSCWVDSEIERTAMLPW